MIDIGKMPIENIVNALSHETDRGLPGNAPEVIVAYMKAVVDRERDRMLYAVRDVVGVEAALKVQLATAPDQQ